MSKRILLFNSPIYLSIKNSQLVLRLPEVEKNDSLPTKFKKEAITNIPVEDIGIVILDHQQITITQGSIDSLLKNNVAFITCDATHYPTGLLMPLNGNYIQNERIRIQLNVSEALKKQLWSQIIKYKIRNQNNLLKKRGIKSDYLVTLYQNVNSGDTNNYEGLAAAYYWKNLFPKISKFKRYREGKSPNNYLNYGYTILRATVARSIIISGLLPTLGLFHKNRYNAYCLADDLMEPYRPFVDEIVCDILEEFGLIEDIPPEIKTILLKIPTIKVTLNGKNIQLMDAIQQTTNSLVNCFDKKQHKLIFPLLK